MLNTIHLKCLTKTKYFKHYRSSGIQAHTSSLSFYDPPKIEPTLQASESLSLLLPLGGSSLESTVMTRISRTTLTIDFLRES